MDSRCVQAEKEPIRAVAIARLSYPVQLIGKLGSDVLGDQLRVHLKDAGVGLAGVENVASYGQKFSQPEGGGAFHTDDPVGWITEGHFTNLNDYGATIWWEKDSQFMQKSIRTGNPQIYENTLRMYHDRVVAAGGTLYLPVPNFHNADQQQLAESLLATSGDLLCYCDPVG